VTDLILDISRAVPVYSYHRMPVDDAVAACSIAHARRDVTESSCHHQIQIYTITPGLHLQILKLVLGDASCSRRAEHHGER
jgi:hypothetical protein